MPSLPQACRLSDSGGVLQAALPVLGRSLEAERKLASAE